MNKKSKIKVIKKGSQVTVTPKTRRISKKDTAREIVSNVTNWVNDFQQRRRDETKQAMEKLFPKQPQANGI